MSKYSRPLPTLMACLLPGVAFADAGHGLRGAHLHTGETVPVILTALAVVVAAVLFRQNLLPAVRSLRTRGRRK